MRENIWFSSGAKRSHSTATLAGEYASILFIFGLSKEDTLLNKILKSIIKRQIPFLIGGTIIGAIMTYYYGFLFTLVVNSAIWWIISYVVSKLLWKNTGLNDQKYLIQYFLAKSKRKEKMNV